MLSVIVRSALTKRKCFVCSLAACRVIKEYVVNVCIMSHRSAPDVGDTDVFLVC